MLAVLEQIEKQPISLATLRSRVPAHTKVLEYDNLPESGSIEKVFGRHKCLIVFYTMHDPRNRPIGHFSTILRHGKGKYEYFSSYGYRPEQEISKTHSSGKLMRLLGKNFVRSSARLHSTGDAGSEVVVGPLGSGVYSLWLELKDRDEDQFEPVHRSFRLRALPKQLEVDWCSS